MPESFFQSYTLLLGPGAPRLVVNAPPRMGGPTTREAALAFARAEVARIGWRDINITRVSRTPSGGYSITVELAGETGAF
jgi:hypothetical protein